VKASHRRRKGFIQSLEHGGKVLMQEDNKVDAAFDFFNDRMGMPAICSHAINLEDLYLPHLNLSGTGNHSTEEEVWGAIQLLPSDRAPGSDGFTTRFLQNACELGCCWHVQDVDISDDHAFPHKVEVDLDMLHVLVLNVVGGEVNGVDVVTVDDGALHQWSVELLK
jgi:hypothetical protein